MNDPPVDLTVSPGLGVTLAHHERQTAVLAVTPDELISFTSPNSPPVTLTVSTLSNAGLITARSSNQAIAIVALGKRPNEFTIAPGAGGHGSATVSFADSAGHRVGVIVSESFSNSNGSPPSVSVNAASGATPPIRTPSPTLRLGQSFVALQPGITSRVTIAEDGYTGSYTVTGANPAIADIRVDGSGANAALLVLARSAGECTVAVRDSTGRQTTLLIRVQTSGIRQALPAARRPD
ncbi:MAG: hypothetical protein ACREM6_07010 [Vulcanimicrobiaceae bacterium]